MLLGIVPMLVDVLLSLTLLRHDHWILVHLMTFIYGVALLLRWITVRIDVATPKLMALMEVLPRRKLSVVLLFRGWAAWAFLELI